MSCSKSKVPALRWTVSCIALLIGASQASALEYGAGANDGGFSTNVAIGEAWTSTQSEWSTAVGYGAEVGTNSVPGTSLGFDAKIRNSARDSTAIGTRSSVGEGSYSSTAVGNHAGIGTGSHESTAVGQGASVGNNSSGSTAVGHGASIGDDTWRATAIGDYSESAHDYSVALGAESKTVVGAETNYTAYGLDAPQSSVGEVAVGTKNGGTRTITGVAAGSRDTDAVNVSQLKAVDERLSGEIGDLDDRLTTAEGEIIDLDNRLTTAEGEIIDLDNRLTTAEGEIIDLDNRLTTAEGDIIDLDDRLTTAEEDIVDLDERVTQNEEDIAQLDKFAVKYDPRTDNPNEPNYESITLGQGAVGDAPVLIDNVRAGRIAADSFQAVNGSQVYAVSSSVADALGGGSTVNPDGTISAPTYYIQGQSYNNVGDAFAGVDNALDQINSELASLNKGVSNAKKEARQAAAVGLAAASLRYDDRPGALSVATGGGYWRNQGAFAFGAGYTTENQFIRANVNAASTGKHWGVGAGVTFTLN
jgi:autotransporter adhesin